jgi:hypothetical protein
VTSATGVEQEQSLTAKAARDAKEGVTTGREGRGGREGNNNDFDPKNAKTTPRVVLG